MFVFVFRRILLFFPVLFGVLMGTFAFVHYGPGDPLSIMFGEEDWNNDPAILARLQKIYGLDRSFLVQFGDYVCGGLCVPDARNEGIIRGDWGKVAALAAGDRRHHSGLPPHIGAAWAGVVHHPVHRRRPLRHPGGGETEHLGSTIG